MEKNSVVQLKILFTVIVLVILVAMSNVVTMSFSTVQSEWTNGKKMPTKRLEVGGVALNNKIYIIGGMDDKGTTDLTEVYDIKTDKWSKASPLPGKRDHLGAAANDGKIYVVGGFNERGISTRTLFIYDPIADKWERCRQKMIEISGLELDPIYDREKVDGKVILHNYADMTRSRQALGFVPKKEFAIGLKEAEAPMLLRK